MEMKKLDFSETLKDSIAIGVKNAPSVVVAVALWLVTIWIPYINIGTTIAISLLPVELAKGSVINPLGIFDSKYRRYMGEYFITMGLMVFPILIGVLFMIVPAIVLSIDRWPQLELGSTEVPDPFSSTSPVVAALLRLRRRLCCY